MNDQLEFGQHFFDITARDGLELIPFYSYDK